jgi:hypothetical protein
MPSHDGGMFTTTNDGRRADKNDGQREPSQLARTKDFL